MMVDGSYLDLDDNYYCIILIYARKNEKSKCYSGNVAFLIRVFTPIVMNNNCSLTKTIWKGIEKII